MGDGNVAVADLDALKILRKAAEEFKLNLEQRQETLEIAASVFEGTSALTKRTLTWITVTSASIQKAIRATEELLELLDEDLRIYGIYYIYRRGV